MIMDTQETFENFAKSWILTRSSKGHCQIVVEQGIQSSHIKRSGCADKQNGFKNRCAQFPYNNVIMDRGIALTSPTTL